MASLRSRFSIDFSATHTGNEPLSPQVHSPQISRIFDLANGTLAKQADISYATEVTIASGGNTDIDLNGALLNGAGVTLAAAKVVGLVVMADPTNTTEITIGAAASNPWVGPFGAGTHTVKLGPNGAFCVVNDILAGVGAVVAGTGDLLRITNASGAAAKVKIGIIGRSA